MDYDLSAIIKHLSKPIVHKLIQIKARSFFFSFFPINNSFLLKLFIKEEFLILFISFDPKGTPGIRVEELRGSY